MKVIFNGYVIIRGTGKGEVEVGKHEYKSEYQYNYLITVGGAEQNGRWRKCWLEMGNEEFYLVLAK